MAVFINCFVRKDKSIKLGNTTVRLEVITMDFLKLYSKWKFHCHGFMFISLASILFAFS